MKVLHLLAGGNIGGIEILMKDYARYSAHENHFIMIWGSNGAATELIKKQGCKVTELNSVGKTKLTNFKTIEQYCRTHDIEAVIVHHAAPLAHLYLMHLKHRIPEITTIAYAHGNAVCMYREEEKRGLKLRRAVLSYSLKRADLVVAISESVADSLVKLLYTPKEKIRVIYNGTDISVHHCIERTEPHDEVRMIFVGRLIEMKGVQLTLQALAQLKTEKFWHFDVVGDGAYRSTLENLASQLGLSDHVSFLGERLNVPQLLGNSDIFVHVPLGEEGFGITIIEAMAAGLVCVCGDSGAIPEIITDGENGYLVPKHDVSALAERLTLEVEENDNREQIKKNAKSRAEMFSVQSFSSQLDDAIDKKAEG